MKKLTKVQLNKIISLQERIDVIHREFTKTQELIEELNEYENCNVDFSVLAQLSAASGSLEVIIENNINGD